MNSQNSIVDKDMKSANVQDTGEQEGSFVKNQLHTIQRVTHHLTNELSDQEDLPEWVEMKISQAQDMIVSVMDYITSAKEIDVDAHGNTDSMMAEGKTTKKTIPASTPRNFVAKNAKTGGSGAHKDKKQAEKKGAAKHKKPYAESHDLHLSKPLRKKKIKESYSDYLHNVLTETVERK